MGSTSLPSEGNLMVVGSSTWQVGGHPNPGIPDPGSQQMYVVSGG